MDTERDQALVAYLKPWLEFQSSVGILADPPAGYMFPGVDIMGGFDNMTRMLEDGDYDNQYDFILDVYRLISVKPREGHLSYRPSLVNIIEFSIGVELVSISQDGTSLPSVYIRGMYTSCPCPLT